MKTFERYYLISAAILCFLAVGAFFSSASVGMFFGSAIPVGLALLAVFKEGGITGNRRLAIGVAVFFAILTGGMLASGFIGFVETKGGEGPKGEGSPLAAIVALVFTATFGFCPWLLTALRGLRLWNHFDD